MSVLLAIGLGFSARAIAARLKGTDWQITGTSRELDGLEKIRAEGYEALRFDGETPSPALAATLSETTHLLISAPPNASGDPLLIHHANDLARAPRLVWIGYLSTIGVYGDRDGAWVDETISPQPLSERSLWRLTAENAWRQFAETHRITLQVFRLAGIYGPGRNALAKIKAGRDQRIEKHGQVFNRIHVEDIATVVEAGIHAGAAAPGIFNVTDDKPAPPQDVSAFAAELLGVSPPALVPWEEADLSPMARSFYMENKRVRNTRIKDVLGVRLAFPTYREGLRSLIG
jgi:nucleoside-diphosphate-sugar epimerase